MTTSAPAWILSLNNTIAVAVGEFELVHTLTDMPTLFTIPKAPVYCAHVMLWQNELIPVMNLTARFLVSNGYNHENHDDDIARLGALSIFAYRNEETGKLEHGALLLNAPPRHCEVYDNEQCELPDEFNHWRYFLLSCFKSNDTKQAIPIICLERLFAVPK